MDLPVPVINTIIWFPFQEGNMEAISLLKRKPHMIVFITDTGKGREGNIIALIADTGRDSFPFCLGFISV